MKKLLIALAAVVAVQSAMAAGPALRYNNFTQPGIFPLESNPIAVESNPPIGLAPGVLIVTNPNNGVVGSVSYHQIQQVAFFTESANRTIGVSRNRNESGVWTSWLAIESGMQ